MIAAGDTSNAQHGVNLCMTNKQNILVLGTQDVIGHQVVKTLAASSWAKPVILAGEATGDLKDCEQVHGSARDGSSLVPVLKRVDAVVAAFTGDPATIRAQATALFVHARAGLENKRAVNVSSMTVYGSFVGNANEATPLGDALSPYAQARVDSEKLAQGHANVVTLRPGCEYGPHCLPWSRRVAQWLSARRLGDLGPRGDGYCNLAYIDDVVSAIASAVQLSDIEGQVFNLAMPEPPTWNEYFIQFAQALGAVPVRRIPANRLRVETKFLAPFLKIGEIGVRAMRLPSALVPPAIPPSAAAVFHQAIKLDSTLATQRLNVRWTALSDGLQNTARWIGGREDSASTLVA
jgi:nucleoside-diphosphate-sugar epimerase